MRRSRGLAIVAVAAASLALAAVTPAAAGAASPEDAPRAPLTLAPGLVAHVAAAPPLVRHPMMAGLDERGRLYVAESSGANLRRAELEARRPHAIRRLEDTDGDGVFDRAVTFADGLTFPQGALWHRGALYVASPPSLWRLEDTDGDGAADRREELVTGFDFDGNAADVHGPFLHPDGRLYWAHGRKGHDVRERGGRPVSRGRAARIWTARLDGSDVGVHAGGGMDNPVEVDFTPEGEVLGTVNLFRGRPRADVLVDFAWGGVYPREDQGAVLAELAPTGPLLDEIFDFGHVAVSGMACVRSDALFGGEAASVLVALFNTQRVVRLVLERRGSTYAARAEDVLKVHDPGAHLTDVVEDADGSVLVVDTGGWFRIGCPTSGLARPEAAGAIYRIRRAGAASRPGAIDDPRGLRLAWDGAGAIALAGRLGDPRFAVRERAVAELAALGPAALGAIARAARDASPLARQNALWTAIRIGGASAQILVRGALSDGHAGVRAVACHGAGAARDRRAAPAVARLLGDPEAFVRRAAAAALGRIGDRRAVGPLVRALAQPVDRFHEHALVHALVAIGDAPGVRPALAARDPDVARRALVALSHMRAAALRPADALGRLDHPHRPLREAAIAVMRARPERGWVAGFAAWARARAARGPIGDDVAAGVAEIAATLLAPGGGSEGSSRASRDASRAADPAAVRALIGEMLHHRDPAWRRVALAALGRAPRPGLDAAWIAPIERALEAPGPEAVAVALGAALACDSRRFRGALGAVAARPGLPAGLRLKALAVVVAGGGSLDEAAFPFLLGQLTAPAASDRAEAARVLSEAPLAPAPLRALAARLPELALGERGIVLKAFARSPDAAAGDALVTVAAETGALSGLPPGDLEALFARYPAAVRDKASPLLAEIARAAAGRRARLDELERAFGEGVARRGAEVYRAGKGACLTCHQIGGLGRAVGPNLSAIGAIRSPRDLLESVLYPSATLARDFESHVVETTTGEARVGVIARETADAVYLVDSAGETAIPRAAIKSVTPGSTSLMPEGLDQALTRAELLDLIAYLKSLDGRGGDM